jgi:hypothetical protein
VPTLPSRPDLQNIVHDLRQRGVTLKATEQPIDTATAAGKCFLEMTRAQVRETMPRGHGDRQGARHRAGERLSSTGRLLRDVRRCRPTHLCHTSLRSAVTEEASRALDALVQA